MKDDNKIGIILRNHIAASMKDDIYDTVVTVTDDELISCSCTCQAGLQGENRAVCVHILPVLLSFTIMIINALGQNLLVELCHRWNDDLEQSLGQQGKIESVKKSILDIMVANGDDIEKVRGSKTIKETLHIFSVGTEKTKLAPTQPRDDELIPLRLMDCRSNNNQVKAILNKKCKVSVDKDSRAQQSKNANINEQVRLNENQEGQLRQPKILKKHHSGLDGVLEAISCDFCDGSSLTTNHICRFPMVNGSRVVEGTTERICGLATWNSLQQ